jgi:hypothetical protein
MTAPTAQAMGDSWRCECGDLNKPDEVFCYRCGAGPPECEKCGHSITDCICEFLRTDWPTHPANPDRVAE